MDDGLVRSELDEHEDDSDQYSSDDERDVPRDAATNRDQTTLLRFVRPGNGVGSKL